MKLPYNQSATTAVDKRTGVLLKPFANRLLDAYAWAFGRPRFAAWNTALLKAALRGLGVLNHNNPTLSGEKDYIKRTIQNLDVNGGIVVDVGANEGLFSELVLRHTNCLRIVAVEAHPDTFSRLQRRLKDKERVTLLNFAAGEKSGEVELYDHAGKDGSPHASLVPGVIEAAHRGHAKIFRVPMHPLDQVIPDGKVVFVKMDIEGFEASAIKGFGERLRMDRPPFLLIEFNEMHVHSRTFFIDICRLLDGYRPYRILPRGTLLPMFPYSPWRCELFAYQNLVFCREDAA